MSRKSIKRSIKHATKWAAYCASALDKKSVSATRILTYHSIAYRGHEMNVTPEDFREQMAWLCEERNVISLDDAAAGKVGIAITFDDGYQNNLLHAAPLLCGLNLPATVFMVAGRAGKVLTGDPEPETGVLMTWEELHRWVDMGLSVGAHTMTHPCLASLNDAGQSSEIMLSKAALEGRLGIAVNAIAYPYGSALDYNKTSMRLARQAGFKYALSNQYGFNEAGTNPWALKRIWVDATDDLASFQAKVLGRLDLLRILDHPAAIRLRRTLNRVLQLR